jgi:hypothetical protein
MFDISHEWAGDLTVDSKGDLALVSGSQTTTQRIRRRLLTNSGDYLWNLDYGAGLAQFVGAPALVSKIDAIVRTQLTLESAVAANPAPQVSTRLTNAADGYVVADITYVDQLSSQPVQINLTAS